MKVGRGFDSRPRYVTNRTVAIMGGFIKFSPETVKVIADARKVRDSKSFEQVKAEVIAERKQREKLFIRNLLRRGK